MGGPHRGGREFADRTGGLFSGRRDPDDLGPHQGPVGGRDPDAPPLHWFVWSLGSVITALLDAGFGIDARHERANEDSYDGLGAASLALPASYHIKATLPR